MVNDSMRPIEKGHQVTILRMPVGFGPALGPRQGPEGQSFNGSWSRCDSFAISFESEREAVDELLPPGFSAPEKPTVKVQTHCNYDIAWLAGRGYNFMEVLFSATFRGEEETVEGDFVSVMWESRPDPVLPGREEIGLPKLFADVTGPEAAHGGSRIAASWDGFEFAAMEFRALDVPGPWPHAEEEAAAVTQAGLGGKAGNPRLYYKYFPRTGAYDQADVAYTTMTPTGNYDIKVLDSWQGTGEVDFFTARWEDLPTMAHIANKLAALPINQYLGASWSRFALAFDDLTSTQRIVR